MTLVHGHPDVRVVADLDSAAPPLAAPQFGGPTDSS